jgi:hypothetical protein
MHAPPDLEMRRAALADGPKSQSHFPYTDDSSETVRELQARSLRHRFALGYYLAATVAQLAFAVSR